MVQKSPKQMLELIFRAGNQKSLLLLLPSQKWTHNFPASKTLLLFLLVSCCKSAEKWRNANYAEMSRIFHQKEARVATEKERKKEEILISNNNAVPGGWVASN